jgi:hypothetical protein
MEKRSDKTIIVKDIFMLTLLMVIVMSCRNNTENNTENKAANDSALNDLPDTTTYHNDSVMTIRINNGTNCFAYIRDQDTISLTLTLQDSLVNGKLIYNFYEKDKNIGTLNGFLRGDTLLATYTYLSEGARSVRQVAFLVKGNILQEGTGSMKEQNGRLVFSSKKDINFNNNIILEPIDCNVFPVK